MRRRTRSIVRSVITGLVAGAAAVAVLAIGQPEVRTWPTSLPTGGNALPPPGWIAAAPGDQEGVPAGLYARRDEVRLEQVPLDEALRVLEEKSGLPFSVNWQSLEFEGVDRQTPVSIEVERVRTADVLDRLLAFGFAEVTWYPEGGGIVIVARDYMPNSAFSTRVYDVRDIMLNAARADQDVDGDDLCDIVTTGATPGQWNERWTSVRAGSATALYFGGRLVVHHHAWGHAEVARVIESLRDSMLRPARSLEAPG